ncbi:hypothetical protein MMC07_005043 [Pseudocyphellaria aurata]|nr:hypothetical protein [Pseudocyphellaria aurata]
MVEQKVHYPDTSSTLNLRDTYHYVVIGGGTSGLVVASRLTEDPDVHVLVLEAGANRLEDPRITTPGLALATWDNPDFDWEFMTTPQTALNGRKVAQPRGKVLGGSAAINLNLIAYPSKSGIDSWGKLGNISWDYETMLPYYQKFHTFAKPSKEVHDLLALDYMDQDLQGTSGPIKTSFGEFHGALHEAWPQTFKAMNLELTGDPLTGLGAGGHSNPSSVDPSTKTRSHAGSEYYNIKVANRPNIRVLTQAFVEKVLFGKAKNNFVTATGVQYRTISGKQNVVYASEEIILAAGVFQSPQILELSGIGPKDLLEAHGIDLVIDNKHVGENLQDHPLVGLSFEAADHIATGDILRDPMVFEAAIAEYNKSKTGFLTAATFCSAFMPIMDFPDGNGQARLESLLDEFLISRDPADFPAQKLQYSLLTQILTSPDDSSVHYIMAPFQLNPDAGDKPTEYLHPTTPGNFMTLFAALSHPFSRGSVHIQSANPKDKPRIDPKYLSHPLDREVLARHVQYMEVLTETEPLTSLLKKNGRRIPSEKYVRDLESAKQLGTETMRSNFHPCGTCAMMPRDIGGVVGERLMVHGTTNLRIVDASIIPLQPRGNIQSSVYAIAERAVDFIVERLQGRVGMTELN